MRRSVGGLVATAEDPGEAVTLVLSGADIPLLLVLVAGSTWYAGWPLCSPRLTSDE